MELAAEAVKEGGTWLSLKVAKHFSYAASNGKYIQKLEKEVVKLENKKIEVDRRVEQSKNQGEDIIPYLEEWQKQAEQIIRDSCRLVESRRNSDAKCCFKLCYDISYLYKNSKEAVLLHKKVNDNYQEAMSFHEVANPPGPRQIIVSSAVTCTERFKSRETLLAQTLNALQCDNINVIVIYGIGGVGKTTLVDKLVQVTEQKLFDVVVKAVVSRTPKIEDIQNQIADRINLRFDGQSVQGRVDQLHQVLLEKLNDKKKILFILDDIWEALDFTAQVGIPRSQGCKIVITSRDKDVLNAGPLNVDKFIEVGALDKKEARHLFNESLGDYSHITERDYQFEALYEELLNYCSGLPLALVTVAGVLKGKDYLYWKDTADKLSKHTTKGIKGMYEKVGSTIELSFHSLKNKEAQMLLLLCSLFPEDELIEVEKLMSCGLGIQIFEDVGTLDRAMARVYTLIDQLKSCSLLLTSENRHGKYCVQMHDVTRDVAKNIIASYKEYDFFEGTNWPKREALATRDAISRSLEQDDYAYANYAYADADFAYAEISSRFDGCYYSHMQMLCLRYWSTSRMYSFEGMEKLRVLDMCIPWSYLDFYYQPSMFQPLKNLQTLHLATRDFRNISIIGQLTNLEFLYLGVNRLEELPKTFKRLTRLKVLDLTKCYQLRKIPADVIPSLSQLEGLFLGYRLRINLFELQSSYHLKALHATLMGIHYYQSISDILSNLFSFNMNIIGNSTCKSIYPYVNEAKFLSNFSPRSLCLQDINLLEPIHFLSMSKLWKGLQVLYCRNVAGLSDLLSYGVIEFSSLRSLKLHQCDDMKYLLGSQAELRKLECLVLRYLPQLEGVGRHGGALWKTWFPTLRELYLDGLPKFMYSTTSRSQVSVKTTTRHLFGPEDLLPAIELLRISSVECEEIWHCPLPADSFCKLHVLEVFDCKELTRIIPFPQLTMMPDLQSIRVVNCENVKEVIQFRDIGSSICLLSQLLTLDLAFLPQLRHLFPALIACTGLVKLKVLKIVGCENLEAVISEDGDEDPADQTNIIPVISNLERIELRNLPHLTYFYSGKLALEFPALSWVRVLFCPSMKSFAPSSPTTPHLRKVIIGYTPWEEISVWEGDLNTTVTIMTKKRIRVGYEDRLRTIVFIQDP